MRPEFIQEMDIGIPIRTIGRGVCKRTNQADIIVVLGKGRLYVLEMSHMERNIATVPMTVCVDQASFF